MGCEIIDKTQYKDQTPLQNVNQIAKINNTGANPLTLGQNKKQFALIRASDVTKNITPTKWLIKDIIPEVGLVEMFGASGSLKSFAVLDMAFAISSGSEWNGHRTVQGNVIYIAGEGGIGVRKRLRALEIVRGVGDYEMFLSEEPMDLASEKSCMEVSSAIKNSCGKASMLVIDTLHRNSITNEDSAEDFAKILQNIDKTLSKLADVVLWVHHSGHSEGNRSRGTSSRFAALDTSIKVSRKDNRVTLSINKQKDAEEHPPITLTSHQVELGIFDDDGESITSLVLQPTDKKDILDELSESDLYLMKIIVSEMKDYSIFRGVNPFEKCYISKSKIRDKVYQLFDDVDGQIRSNEANKKKYQRDLKRLKDLGYLEIRGSEIRATPIYFEKYGTEGTMRDISQLSLGL